MSELDDYLNREQEKLASAGKNPIPDPATSTPTRNRPVVSVKLVGLDVPFWDLVAFMVTAAIASIPAFAILFIIGAFLFILFQGFLGVGF